MSTTVKTLIIVFQSFQQEARCTQHGESCAVVDGAAGLW